MATLKPHPLSELLPQMSDAERASMKADLEANKQIDDAWLFHGMILDGRHRYAINEELGRPTRFKEFKGTYEQAYAFVLSKAHHRHLSESQKACVGAKFMAHLEGGRKPGGKFATYTGKSRDHAETFCGASARYVQEAKLLLQNDASLFGQVFTGSTKLHVAARAFRRQTKQAQQRKQAKAHRRLAVAGAFNIITGDAIVEMRKLVAGSVRLIFADTPYNIGIDYGNGAKADQLDPTSFKVWLSELFEEAKRVLASDGSIFVMISSEWASELDVELMKIFGRRCRRGSIVWHETFGTYQSGNFTDCHRVIHYYTMSPTTRVWHGDQILIPSARQETYNDSRANPAGKVPGNVWSEFPRLVDNAVERVPGFPTQIPWKLVERIVRVASDPGDLVFDPCTGSGTTGEACLRNDRQFVGTELVPTNAAAARARLTNVAAELAAKGKA